MSFKTIALVVLGLTCVGSIGARYALADPDPEPDTSSPGALASGLVGDLGLDAAKEPGAVEQALPYVSEGSFFALIGFALGYLSRKLVKIGLIVLAVVFLAVQGLSFGGVISVDWDKLLALANDLVLNVKSNQSLSEMVKHKLPSAGGLALGYVLGFRKG